MRKNFTLTILFLVFRVAVSAQLNPPVEPFEQIKWKNLKTKWYITEYDETMKSDSCDGYNYFYNLYNDPKKIIKDDYFIGLYYLRGKRASPTGSFISKRNLQTGEKIWHTKFDILQTGNRTNISRLLYISESEKLVHVGQMPMETYPKSPASFGTLNTNLTKSTYDVSDGSSLNSWLPIIPDSTLDNMSFHSLKYQNYNHLFVEGEGYRVVRPVKYIDNKDYKLISYWVDDKGRKVGETDSIPYYSGERFINFARISKDTFLYVESRKLTDTLKFNYVDRHLNTLKKITLKESIKINDLLLNDIQNGKLIFTSVDAESDPFEPPISMFIYDLSGTRLLNAKVNLENHQKYPIPLMYSKTDELFLFTLYAKKIESGVWNFALNVYKMSNDSMLLISSFGIEDKDRFLNVNSVYELPDGDILLEIQENNMITKSNNYVQDGNARAMSTMRLSPEALGLIPTSTKTEIYGDQLNIYPNPSEGSIRIVFPNGINEGVLEVYDSSGKKVKSQEFDKHLSNFFDMGDLSAGMYLIKAMDKSGKSTVVKLVVGQR